MAVEQPRPSFPSQSGFLIIFALIALVGIGLRIYPSGTFAGLGYDENLYRGYVDSLSASGVGGYPTLAEHYLERQQSLSAAILPPTRFLYIFFAYLWHQATGIDPLVALRHVSCFFSILLLGLSGLFACRLGGQNAALGVFALMSCAPTQIHMAQHALIDGFFAFWATLCLWLLWENLQRPHKWPWLISYLIALALLVLTKENAMFAYVALLVLLAANYWLRFGRVTKPLLVCTVLGPLLGVAILVNLCGSLETTVRIFLLLVSKASVLPYAVATGDGPWHRYLVDLMLMSPVILVLAIGRTFSLKATDKASLFLLTFVIGSYALMANVRYGMNLRYTNMWDLPLRYLAFGCLANLSASFGKRANLWLGIFIVIICAVELRQYVILFVQYGLYELVTGGLLRALRILK